MNEDIGLTPVGEYIIVKPIQESDTIGGVYIPDTAKEIPTKAIIISVGDEANKEKSPPLKAGQKILIAYKGAVSVMISGETYMVTTRDNIFGFFTN